MPTHISDFGIGHGAEQLDPAMQLVTLSHLL